MTAQQPDSEASANKDRLPGSRTELRRSRLAPVLMFLYRVLNCGRRWRIARILLAVALRLEGRMLSATARQMMGEFHGVWIGAYSYGDCFDPGFTPPGITIGRYTSIASGVRMFVQNHPLDRLSMHPYFYEQQPGVSVTADLPPGHLDVGHDVWIGCNALILPSCHRIGNGAVIGAGAVVTKDVPDFAIVVGSPAKHIRDRFSDEVKEKILASQWWMLPGDEVRARMPEFRQLLNSETPTEVAELANARASVLAGSQQ